MVGHLDQERIVRRHHGEHVALVDEPAQQGHHHLRPMRVELAGRFVGDEEARLVAERARDRDALLLAAGQLGRPVMRTVAEVDEVKELVDARLAARAG